MNTAIVSKDYIRTRARADYERGCARDDHGFNWHAAALPTWLEEWDRCDAVVKADRELCGVEL